MSGESLSKALALYASEVVVGAMERELPIGELAREIARREMPPTVPTLKSIEMALMKEITAEPTELAIGFNMGIWEAIKIVRRAGK